MNNKAALSAMAALALLAACNGDSADTAAGGNAAGAAPSSNAAAAAGTPVTREALVGTWGQNNCTNTMSFAADGTAESSSAQQANNRWSLDGSTIVIATLVNGELHLTGGGGEGQSTVLTRCEAEAAESENETAEEAAE
jgi:hypothetical protein